MSMETAKKVSLFLKNNGITYINCTGGEFFTHPQWFEVLSTICDGMKRIRLVTNGDWIGKCEEKVKEFAFTFNAYLAISKDRWHTNKNVERARKFCEENGIAYQVATEDQTTTNSIVPIGRSSFECNMYSTFMTYCSKPDRKYSFLIDEDGLIYKCPFGIWDYATVDEYVDGGFSKRFKEFTSIFYSTFITNCRTCIRIEGGRDGNQNVWQ